MGTALDFRRYAPERPQPRPEQPASPLMQAFRYLGLAIRLTVLTRIVGARLAFHKAGRSLMVAWAFGGFGWGTALGAILLYIWGR
jgi:hypothetical protein